MLHLKNYRAGVDTLGLLLYAVVLLPNLIWSVLPPPFDVLVRIAAVRVDEIARLMRVALFVSLCLVVNRGRTTGFKTRCFFGIMGLLLVYFCGWSLYYAGFMNFFTVMIICVAPCAAFVVFAAARENLFALVTALLFSVFHFLQFLMVEF